MGTLWKDIEYKVLRSGSKLNLLIGINIFVYLIINIPATFEFLFSKGKSAFIDNISTDYLALTAYLPKLLTRFWTPFTYMFMHAGALHILYNMLWFYWMGQIFEEFLGKKRTMGLYLLGGFAGAFAFVLSYNLFPFFHNYNIGLSPPMVGASAAIMAIVIATATLLPDYTVGIMFIGPVSLKWIALFFVVTDFLGLKGFNAGGEIAHLSGALVGFLYIKQLQNGNDWIANINKLFKPRPKLKVVANNQTRSTVSRPRQDEIDAILDKISKSGYDSLSKQEKEILFRASSNEG